MSHKTTEQKVERIRKEVLRVRSLKGAPLPETIINKICELQAARPDLYFTIESAHGLIRDIPFFQRYCSSLRFIDERGKYFHFSKKARPVLKDEIFVGIFYPENTDENKRVRIYARFPFGK